MSPNKDMLRVERFREAECSAGCSRMSLMPFTKPSRRVVSLLVLAALPCASALAALGGGAASVEADRARLNGALRVAPQANYIVHEITTGSGLQVHEYLSAGGKVFAVSWRGPGIPDLKQMLGSYYGEYAQAASAPHYNHHHLSIETPDVIVQSSGHTRAFFGRAWVPALLPQNFSVDQIN
jgi:Protein of unknown function (DUF2844)